MADPSRLLQELERLVCPVCHARLRADGQFVLCTACSRRYPVLDGIPVLLESRAV